MSTQVVVQIVAALVRCDQGVQERWREVADWAAAQLQLRYGSVVRVDYYDLFDVDVPALPSHAQLPVVIVNSTVVSCGGKISLPLIRRQIEMNADMSR